MQKYSVREAPSTEGEKELLAYSPLVRQLLYGRGITSGEEAEKFLNPHYENHCHDPFALKDMEKVVVRILTAVRDNEKITIFSDYDADGIPGAVVLHDFFKKLGYTNFVNYIPDRHTEGFGLSTSAVEQFGKDGTELLITIDCGITDVEEALRARELGIDVIITDHHLPAQSGLPPAFAILNPKQADCAYPEKMLCGSGVVFKLVQALCLRLRSPLEFGACDLGFPATIFPVGQEKWLLDMVGIATLSDMVPLTGENRVLAHYGLKVLRKSPRVGLGQLLLGLRLNRKDITEDDVGFSISPRINAASRMGVPMDAFRLFATTDEVEAGALAKHLDKINDERKGKVASLVKEVRKTVEERGVRKVVVAGNPNWRPALLGLVANSLAEDMQCPVFLWGRDLPAGALAQAGGGLELKGSCRSGGSVDLSVLMHEARSVFSDFGGHKEAGGFSTTLEQVHLLEEELERAYEKVRTEQTLDSTVFADAVLSFDEVTLRTYQEVEKLAPFGVGNHKPIFLFENAKVRKMEQFGKEKQHLKLTFAKTDGVYVQAIKFYATIADFSAQLQEGSPITLLAHLEKSTFNNRTELRLRIVDIV
ncbi:MAG: single-stranded-DNA-specific exonuclease RecJ [bacterium]|nr:single-stranded-DNA-specific exonuclease RecJ [bacterium]